MIKKLVCVMAAVGLIFSGAAMAKEPKVGALAPDFTLTLLDGGKVSLADLRGQVIVLNIWATWCGPCRTELPLIDGYYDLMKQHGLRVYAIEQQGQGSVPLAQLKKFLGKLAMPSARRIKGPYADVTALPTNYVIDRAGVLRYARSGAFTLDGLNDLLVPLLREPAPPPVPAAIASAD